MFEKKIKQCFLNMTVHLANAFAVKNKREFQLETETEISSPRQKFQFNAIDLFLDENHFFFLEAT